ncbi:MAG: alpha/beta hydrolase [Streptosporangiaceae bacterium]
MLARLALAVVSVVALAPPVTTAGPYAAPAVLPGLSPQTLTVRYAAARHEIERAVSTARRVRDRGRARDLSVLLSPGRSFLSFDARGAGRIVEVDGDLAGADRIAVVVPGAGNRIGGFDSWKFAGGAARSLYLRTKALDPAANVAVIAWLGYDSPAVVSRAAVTAGRAVHAATDLRGFVRDLKAVNRTAEIGLFCHSYGGVVCAKAAPGLPVADLALVGSPGTTADRAADLRTPARVWAARSTGDWIRHVPNIRFLGLGFGRDPISRSFGATVFDAGSGSHSQYFRPGSRSLRNLSLIALGQGA